MSKSISLSDKINTLFSGISKLYKVNPKFSWLLIVISLLSSLSYLPNNNQASQQTAEVTVSNPEMTGAAIAIGIITVLLTPLFIALLIIIEGMFAYATLQASKGKKPTVKEAFLASKSKFWTLLLVGIIVFFKVLGGLILFIIPGIRAICRYIPASMVVFDKNLSASETVNYTKEISKNNLTIEFVLIIAAGIIAPIGYFLQQGGLVGLYPFLKKQAKDAKA